MTVGCCRSIGHDQQHDDDHRGDHEWRPATREHRAIRRPDALRGRRGAAPGETAGGAPLAPGGATRGRRRRRLAAATAAAANAAPAARRAVGRRRPRRGRRRPGGDGPAAGPPPSAAATAVAAPIAVGRRPAATDRDRSSGSAIGISRVAELSAGAPTPAGAAGIRRSRRRLLDARRPRAHGSQRRGGHCAAAGAAAGTPAAPVRLRRGRGPGAAARARLVRTWSSSWWTCSSASSARRRRSAVSRAWAKNSRTRIARPMIAAKPASAPTVGRSGGPRGRTESSAMSLRAV